MKMVSYLKKIKLAIKAANDVMKYGGINTADICQIKWENVLREKRILITGAGSGIGFAIAKKCVECGADVIITGRNEDKLKEAVKKIGGSYIHYVTWDIRDINDIEKKLDECNKRYGEINVLINNAGVQPEEFFPNVTEKEWNRIYDTNSKGTFFMTEEVCKRWMINKKQKGYRKIINIDSQGGFVGATYPYRMSKWDIRGLTEGLGLKMAPYNVLVNAIAPGVVKTEMQKFSMKQGTNMFCDQNPLSRVCLPEEVAEVAVFMISDACNFMAGQTILFDGGFTLN